MYKRKRDRVNSHLLEDDKEEVFLSLKTRLEILSDMDEIYKNDPEMQQQLDVMKRELKIDIFRLVQGGIDLMDLYKRFGAVLFKSQILNGQEMLERLSRGREKQLVDLVNEDALLQQRLAALNDPGRIAQEQNFRAGAGQNIFVNAIAPPHHAAGIPPGAPRAPGIPPMMNPPPPPPGPGFGFFGGPRMNQPGFGQPRMNQPGFGQPRMNQQAPRPVPAPRIPLRMNPLGQRPDDINILQQNIPRPPPPPPPPAIAQNFGYVRQRPPLPPTVHRSPPPLRQNVDLSGYRQQNQMVRSIMEGNPTASPIKTNSNNLLNLVMFDQSDIKSQHESVQSFQDLLSQLSGVPVQQIQQQHQNVNQNVVQFEDLMTQFLQSMNFDQQLMQQISQSASALGLRLDRQDILDGLIGWVNGFVQTQAQHVQNQLAQQGFDQRMNQFVDDLRALADDPNNQNFDLQQHNDQLSEMLALFVAAVETVKLAPRQQSPQQLFSQPPIQQQQIDRYQGTSGVVNLNTSLFQQNSPNNPAQNLQVDVSMREGDTQRITPSKPRKSPARKSPARKSPVRRRDLPQEEEKKQRQPSPAIQTRRENQNLLLDISEETKRGDYSVGLAAMIAGLRNFEQQEIARNRSNPQGQSQILGERFNPETAGVRQRIFNIIARLPQNVTALNIDAGDQMSHEETVQYFTQQLEILYRALGYDEKGKKDVSKTPADHLNTYNQQQQVSEKDKIKTKKQVRLKITELLEELEVKINDAHQAYSPSTDVDIAQRLGGMIQNIDVQNLQQIENFIGRISDSFMTQDAQGQNVPMRFIWIETLRGIWFQQFSEGQKIRETQQLLGDIITLIRNYHGQV